MDWIVIPANVLIIFGTIYKVFELYVRKEERKLIINKIEEIKGVDLSETNLDMGNNRGNRFLSLRIGMLVFGIGLGCIISVLLMVMLLPRLNQLTNPYYGKEILSSSCICLFGGLALVISYIIEQKALRKNSGKENSND